MVITTRSTWKLVELNVDETEAYLFKDCPNEVEDTIRNLLSVCNDLAQLIGKKTQDFIDE